MNIKEIKEHDWPKHKTCMKNAVFWDVALCRSCVNRRSRGKYRLHLQGRKILERGTSVSRWQLTAAVPPKSRPTQDLHGATSQRATFFIVTAVKTSNLIKPICYIKSIYYIGQYITGARGSKVGWETMLQAEGRGIESQWGGFFQFT
jgi:hypothetical protein